MRSSSQVAILLLCCFSLSVQAHVPEREPPPSAADLRGWAEGPCEDAARHVGINYSTSLNRAITMKPDGLATLFRFTDTGWFDGAAAEGHCAILFGLLQRWGDARFSRVLAAQNKSVRKAVFIALSTFPGWSAADFRLTNRAGSR